MMVVDNRSDSDGAHDSGSEDSLERERNKYLNVGKPKKIKHLQPIEKDDDIGFEDDSIAHTKTPPKRKVPKVESNRVDSPIQRNADTPTESKEEDEIDQQSYVSSWLGGISSYAPQSERIESVKSLAASVMKNRY
jgi:hypothetical protein